MKSRGAAGEMLSAERSRPIRWLIRAGFAARAVTYALIGVLAVALALGAGTDGTTPDQQGALALIDRAPLGGVALGVIAAGLLAYAGWKITQAVVGHGPEGGGDPDLKDRLFNFLGGAAYLVFFGIAVRVLVTGSSGGSGEARRTTAGILAWPAGPVIVGLGGAILIVVSAYQTWDAISGGFAEEAKTGEMGRDERRTFTALGRVGLTARAAVFALVGYFLLRAALDYSPGSAVGLDGALARVGRSAYGPWLLCLAAGGLLVFAAYSLLEGRYRRL